MFPIIPNVPFYSNTKDNTHCHQAVLRMILKHFEPEKDFSWKDLDQLTAKVKGKGTWPTQGFINIARRGYDIKIMEDFDYHRFIKEGGQYLFEKYGEKMAEEQIKMCDIDQEIRIMKQFIQLFPTSAKPPGLNDIKELLTKGYLIGCNVNYNPLYHKKGYSGHFVLIYGINHAYIFLHDPGLPPNSHAKVKYADFTKAWAYPDRSAQNLCAYKLKR